MKKLMLAVALLVLGATPALADTAYFVTLNGSIVAGPYTDLNECYKMANLLRQNNDGANYYCQIKNY